MISWSDHVKEIAGDDDVYFIWLSTLCQAESSARLLCRRALILRAEAQRYQGGSYYLFLNLFVIGQWKMLVSQRVFSDI